MGHPVDDAILQAGAQLMQAWKNPAHQIPNTDLNPRTDHLQFKIQLLEGRIAELEVITKDILKVLRNGR